MAALAAAGAGAPGRAGASDLQISPVLVELSAAAPRAHVVLANQGDEPVRLEVSAFAWDQAPDGEMQLAATEDVLFYPPVLELKPGEKRNLRVGTKATAGPAERSYRIFVQEMPAAERPGSRSEVRVLSRIGIPVFVAPAKAVVRAEVSGAALSRGRLAFAVRNAGTVRIRPSAVRVDALSADGRALSASKLEAWYVLPGGERRYDLALPAEACSQVRALEIDVALDGAPLRSRVEAPGGACVP